MENSKIPININIIVGFIIIVLSLIVLIFGAETLIVLILLLSFVFLFIGFGRIFNGITNESLSRTNKITKYLTGALSIIISLVVISIALGNPSLAILIFTNLFGYTLIFIGISRISIGYLAKSYSKNVRVTIISVGIITIIFAILILVFPTFGYFILVMLISFALFLNGLTRVLVGYIDAKSS